jgi:FAD-dependent urate hydroxylase
MPVTNALIIGAGPFGLSISAYLRDLGVEHTIVGRAMDTWRSHMPAGMCLKSEPYASVIAAPHRGYDLSAYSAAHGLDYVDRVGPLALERFLGYADWYTSQLVPDVRDLTATKVTPRGGEFEVEFANADPIVARQVVVATGVLPHRHLPAELTGLPSDLVTHSCDHHELASFRQRRVAVIGAGQSALETAALLHEGGADVRLIARAAKLYFVYPNPEHVSLAGRIRRPVTRLCEGWGCAFWNTPAAFRLLSEGKRIDRARTVLGPSGSWWLRDRVEGVVEALTGHRVQQATPHDGGVRLSLGGVATSDGTTTMDVDHVIAGTGFRVDVARLPFLPEELLARVASTQGYPVLSRAGESTVPGLYFAGAMAAGSLGPSERFIAGTHNAAAVLAKSVARRARASSGRPRIATGHGEQPVTTSR